MERPAPRAQDLERLGLVEHVLIEDRPVDLTPRERFLHELIEVAGRPGRGRGCRRLGFGAGGYGGERGKGQEREKEFRAECWTIHVASEGRLASV